MFKVARGGCDVAEPDPIIEVDKSTVYFCVAAGVSLSLGIIKLK